MSPFFIDYAGVRWTRVGNNKREPRSCWLCDRTIRVTAHSYRTRNFGGLQIAYMHQKCLIGQIDPTVWDIPIG